MLSLISRIGRPIKDRNLTDCGNPKHEFLNPRPLERSEKIISAGNNNHRECFNPNSKRFKIQKQLHVTRLEILTFKTFEFV